MRVVMLTAADVRRYRDLMLEAYAQAPDAFTSTPQERAAQPESWWIGRIANPAGWTAAVGAFDGDELVGAVALEFSAKPKTRHKALLIGMYVAPAARGQGIGRRLMDAALEVTRGRGDISVVTLTVTEGNEAALHLYRAAGFAAFGVEPMAILTPGGYKAKVHMWLSVAQARVDA
ncbi:MAG: GNAT family N-acetyltransferase [Rubrivivax sp.]|nr:GNAT family N-acetyltransferase [Rubrivivax sp.]